MIRTMCFPLKVIYNSDVLLKTIWFRTVFESIDTHWRLYYGPAIMISTMKTIYTNVIYQLTHRRLIKVVSHHLQMPKPYFRKCNKHKGTDYNKLSYLCSGIYLKEESRKAGLKFCFAF